MKAAEYTVVWSKKAEDSIVNILNYISERGYPESASKFFKALEAFGNDLGNLPYKFPVCKQRVLSKHKYRCALFGSNYVFVYRITDKKVYIINVIHTSLLF
jgi:plasmid stabilization system protein ParE